MLGLIKHEASATDTNGSVFIPIPIIVSFPSNRVVDDELSGNCH